MVSGCATTPKEKNIKPLNLNCASLSYFASINSEEAVSVSFTNHQQDKRSLYWIDFDGKEVHYKTLQQGETYHVTTYLTHPWVVRNEKQACVGTYMPNQLTPEVVL